MEMEEGPLPIGSFSYLLTRDSILHSTQRQKERRKREGREERERGKCLCVCVSPCGLPPLLPSCEPTPSCRFFPFPWSSFSESGTP